MPHGLRILRETGEYARKKENTRVCSRRVGSLLLQEEYEETELRCRKVEELGKLVNLQGFNITKVGDKPTATVTAATSSSSYPCRYVSN
jgi:hypothetical protein